MSELAPTPLERLPPRPDERGGPILYLKREDLLPYGGGHKMRRRAEAERHRIADVEVLHPCACRFHFLRFRDDVADSVRKAMDTGGGRNRGLGFGCRHAAILTES